MNRRDPFEPCDRPTPTDQLGTAQRLASTAFEAGAPRVSADPTLGTPDPAATDHVDHVDYADYLLIMMRRLGTPADAGSEVLARNDVLLAPPAPRRRYTHPCPLCTRPAIHQARYPRAVCDRCARRTTDHAGRRVTGTNASLSGGMIAYYTDTLDQPDGSGAHTTPTECVEVTRTGVCYVDGRTVTMQEARFGGIVVQAPIAQQ